MLYVRSFQFLQSSYIQLILSATQATSRAKKLFSYPQSLNNRALFNFQNFGNEQPKRIQLCMLSIPQKISCWGIMKQTKLNLVTIWRIARKTYGKLEELTLMVILIWPILRVRSFWRQHLHLQTPWKLTKVRKYYSWTWQ